MKIGVSDCDKVTDTPLDYLQKAFYYVQISTDKF